MRTPLVAGNWKMNGLRADAAQLARAVALGAGDFRHIEILLCPPFTVLETVTGILQGSALHCGGQNAFWEAHGAYTGETSAEMLRDAGCSHVILGHSERRQIFAESDEMVTRKVHAARRAGLIPLLCVGETLDERKAGQTEAVVERQLQAVLQSASATDFQGTVVAYEPVWAIGTGLTATPEQAQAVHAFLRDVLRRHDAILAEHTRILYGGSVKADNAADLFAQKDVDGFLVGGASLQAADFLKICAAATQGEPVAAERAYGRV